MNYEEKYKQALKRAKTILKLTDNLEEANGYVFTIFPELCESEDERIRKEILEYFQQFENEGLHGVNISDWIAWLEKQDEQKSTDSYCQKNCNGFQETGKCFADGECKAKIEAEQNHTWSEEDEGMIECIIAAIKMGDYYTQDELNRMTSWLKSLKPNHWKPSEEQMQALNWIAYNYALMDKETEEKLQSLYNDLKNLESWNNLI